MSAVLSMGVSGRLLFLHLLWERPAATSAAEHELGCVALAVYALLRDWMLLQADGP